MSRIKNSSRTLYVAAVVLAAALVALAVPLTASAGCGGTCGW